MNDTDLHAEINEYETVFCVNDIYGFPLSGVALYNGKPHAFERVFDYNKDDWSDDYLLIPINEEIVTLVVENWNFWLDWMNNNNAAPHPVSYKELRDTVSKESIVKMFDEHICEDRWNQAEKYYLNSQIIDSVVKAKDNSFLAKGNFLYINDGRWGHEDRMPKLVKWEAD